MFFCAVAVDRAGVHDAMFLSDVAVDRAGVHDATFLSAVRPRTALLSIQLYTMLCSTDGMQFELLSRLK
jgi:hypothetical protein